MHLYKTCSLKVSINLKKYLLYIILRELKAGTQVWAMKTNFIESFVQGTVMSLREGNLFKVRIDDGKGMPPKLYNAKQLAYRELCNVVIPVGTRIIGE